MATRSTIVASVLLAALVVAGVWYVASTSDRSLDGLTARGTFHRLAGTHGGAPGAEIGGVSGSLWVATRTREWDGLHEHKGEVDDSAPPALRPNAWFAPTPAPPPPPPNKKRGVRALAAGRCKSQRWVVITSIFAPSRLMFQLAALEGWCTVIVADKKTPVSAWDDVTASGRVTLLTVEEQGQLGFRIAALLPWNHFGRKNIGFLYAIREGARYVYDTDDDNILKEGDGVKPSIPILDARVPTTLVAQAHHCNHTAVRGAWKGGGVGVGWRGGGVGVGGAHNLLEGWRSTSRLHTPTPPFPPPHPPPLTTPPPPPMRRPSAVGTRTSRSASGTRGLAACRWTTWSGPTRRAACAPATRRASTRTTWWAPRCRASRSACSSRWLTCTPTLTPSTA